MFLLVILGSFLEYGALYFYAFAELTEKAEG